MLLLRRVIFHCRVAPLTAEVYRPLGQANALSRTTFTDQLSLLTTPGPCRLCQRTTRRHERGLGISKRPSQDHGVTVPSDHARSLCSNASMISALLRFSLALIVLVCPLRHSLAVSLLRPARSHCPLTYQRSTRYHCL